MKETIEILERLRDQLRVKKSNCQKDGYTDMAMAYSDAILLVGEEIVLTINNAAKNLL